MLLKGKEAAEGRGFHPQQDVFLWDLGFELALKEVELGLESIIKLNWFGGRGARTMGYHLPRNFPKFCAMGMMIKLI